MRLGLKYNQIKHTIGITLKHYVANWLHLTAKYYAAFFPEVKTQYN